ncbi:hypothetical protein ISN44_As02g005760 [Arabidopsis suecica]|uniref:Reverse transcriptase zinc-binding domain-containing protein n=1 Tax=Arabidopsis suecica TaxID=45249 RepID=A0A8T2FXB9_ARASU|nr:hypothetical protein ISN44_As02g005760 [Arabidopsis suecica]
MFTEVVDVETVGSDDDHGGGRRVSSIIFFDWMMWTSLLWSGNVDDGKGAKVAWAAVCLPKAEGGFGLRRLLEWNKTLCLRLIWLLFNNNGSLWASWHCHHYLKNKSFWKIEASQRDPWSWKMLLNLRPLTEQFVRSKVGNRLKTSFWHDSWTSLGPLIKCLGDFGSRILRIPISARVVDAYGPNGWRLPLSRSPPALAIYEHISTLPAPSSALTHDPYYWCVGNVVCKGFSTAVTWNALQPRATEKDWVTSVWFKGAVPRHAFNMWVWKQVFSRLCPRQCLFCSWVELLSCTRLSSTKAPSLLRKITAQTVIYNSWRQRNNNLHNSTRLAPFIIFKLVDHDLRNLITSQRHRKHWQRLMLLWIC